MKVTLAYTWQNPDTFQVHLPDSTIEVDDATGRQLLSSGNARLPVPPSRKRRGSTRPAL
ncbi:MAG TPA: hypothetical protein VFN21_11735 [Acidimicrobiales bacterium]|nr:hypothetical protein [Acidimicrobiales bacterium]